MGITSNIIKIQSGRVFFVPSGSNAAPGTAVAANSVPQHFVITCSANTSNRLAPALPYLQSGSAWHFHSPAGNSYKIFYEPTGGRIEAS